jgi:hypothetical protein
MPLEVTEENVKGNSPCTAAVDDKRCNLISIIHASYPNVIWLFLILETPILI